MSVAASENAAVSLHTEAKSIKDWEAVCMHVCDRAESMMSETQAFSRLFDGLMKTYQQYRDMTQSMRNAIATNKDYIDVPDYHETAIFQGFETVIQCLNVMAHCYDELYKELEQMNKEIIEMDESVAKFSEKIIPQTHNEKQFYLQKENELQNIMQIYMKAAESNHPAFFIIARRYRAQLLEFQHIVKRSTDSLHDIIDKVQTKEHEKRQFEIAKQKQFVERILTIQTQIKAVFNSSMEKIQNINGKDAWDTLVEKLGIYNVSPALLNDDNDNQYDPDEVDEVDETDATKSEAETKNDDATHDQSVSKSEQQRKLTIFDEPVPNTAGALIRSWLQRDMEMSAFVDVSGVGSTLYMVVTRWGFVQMFKHKDDISAAQEFYLYDYDVDVKHTHMTDAENITQVYLCVRQHRTFAPIKNVNAKYNITFQSQEACAKFVELLKQFQASHAPQT